MDTNQIQGTARDVEGKIKDGYGGLTGDTATQVDGKIDQAAGKIQAHYGETVEKVADGASATVSELRRKFNDTVKSVQTEARGAGETVYAQSAKIGEAVNETVHQSPWLSILGVAAIGYLASFLIHSPSSPLAPREPESKYIPRRVARYL